MKKTCVTDDKGRVVHIGPWDYRIQISEGSQFVLDEHGFKVMGEDGKPRKQKFYERVVTNPMPPGYTVCEAEVVEGADGGLYAAEDHIGARRIAYPSLADQLDALWKGGPEAAEMRERVLAVKALYPKAGAS